MRRPRGAIEVPHPLDLVVTFRIPDAGERGRWIGAELARALDREWSHIPPLQQDPARRRTTGGWFPLTGIGRNRRVELRGHRAVTHPGGYHGCRCSLAHCDAVYLRRPVRD